jgi:hypothetical protein
VRQKEKNKDRYLLDTKNLNKKKVTSKNAKYFLFGSKGKGKLKSVAGSDHGGEYTVISRFKTARQIGLPLLILVD